MEHHLSVVCSASGHKHHCLCYGGGCVTGARREFFLEFKGDFCNVAIDSSPRINGSVGCSFFAKSEIGRYMETLHLYISLPACIFWTNTQFSRCFLLLWPYFLVTRSLLNTLWFIRVVSKDMLISKVLGKVSGDFHYTTYHVLHEENRHSRTVYGSYEISNCQNYFHSSKSESASFHGVFRHPQVLLWTLQYFMSWNIFLIHFLSLERGWMCLIDSMPQEEGVLSRAAHMHRVHAQCST